MKSRVSSTVTKRKPNPRPRKYASASERQAAYRARAPEVCFRAEDKTVDTLDRIAADLDVSRADLLLSMTKFALTNHDWARFGLTHKPLQFGYGTQDETRKENPVKMTKRQEVIEFGKRMGFKASAGKGYVYLTNMVGFGETFDDWDKAHAYVLKAYDDHYVHRTPYPWDYKENPTMKTTTKRKPTPAQLAARERFAEAARSGAFKKGAKRKKNPDGMGSYGPFYGDTDAPMTEAQIERKAESYMDRLDRQLMRNEITQTVYDREVKALDKWAKDQYAKRRKTNPAAKSPSTAGGRVKRNPAPAKQRMGRIVRVDPKTGVPFGTELVSIDFAFKEYVGNYQQDFFARTEGAQLVVSEKSTGAKVGTVPYTLRSAALNDRAAAKAFVQKTVEKVGADRFNDAIRKAPKLTA